MKTELAISWRYLGKTRRERFFSLIGFPLLAVVTGLLALIFYPLFKKDAKFISLFSISILGIAIGVMALIVVIAVMAGFDRDLRDKIVGNYSHITITSFDGIDAAKYDKLIQEIGPNPHVKGISPNVQGQVLVKQANKFIAVALRGINPLTEPQVTKIDKYVFAGTFDSLAENEIIIGKELAFYLGLGINSELEIFSPQGKRYTLKVAGIFNSGMYDYDVNLMFTNLKTSQNILGLGDQITSIAVKLDNLYAADTVRYQLSQSLGTEYMLKTWMEMNQSFFAALKLEKLTMFIILTLITLVASFNIVSTLIVLVVEKTKDIGILKALGMSGRQIRAIFTFEGLIIGFFGVLFGALGGIGLCVLLKKYQFIKLPQDIYYIDRLPVYIQIWPDIVIIVFSAMVIALIATIYPASKAARLDVVEALRYE